MLCRGAVLELFQEMDICQKREHFHEGRVQMRVNTSEKHGVDVVCVFPFQRLVHEKREQLETVAFVALWSEKLLDVWL